MAQQHYHLRVVRQEFSEQMELLGQSDMKGDQVAWESFLNEISHEQEIDRVTARRWLNSRVSLAA